MSDADFRTRNDNRLNEAEMKALDLELDRRLAEVGIVSGGAAGPYRITSDVADPDTVARILRSLPEWFGVESANRQYVESARQLPTYLAWPAASPSEPAGVLLAARHFPASAEIQLLAVDRAWHRRGIGTALIRALEADLVTDGARLIQVKTLGPSQSSTPYDGTREFYTRQGFLPLEEIHGLWPGNPCLVMVKSL